MPLFQPLGLVKYTLGSLSLVGDIHTIVLWVSIVDQLAVPALTHVTGSPTHYPFAVAFELSPSLAGDLAGTTPARLTFRSCELGHEFASLLTVRHSRQHLHFPISFACWQSVRLPTTLTNPNQPLWWADEIDSFSLAYVVPSAYVCCVD